MRAASRGKSFSKQMRDKVLDNNQTRKMRAHNERVDQVDGTRLLLLIPHFDDKTVEAQAVITDAFA